MKIDMLWLSELERLLQSSPPPKSIFTKQSHFQNRTLAGLKETGGTACPTCWQPESAGLPSTRSIAAAFQSATEGFCQLVEIKEIIG
jgi:hypothetical protein